MRRQRAIQTDTLLHRAEMFRVLALALAYPQAGHREALLRAMRAARAGHREARRVFRDALLLAWREPTQEELAAEYARLFLGQGPCSLHETAYGDGRRINGRPVELADIAGFYRAFGLQPAEDNPDLPDLLPTELEFYSLLCVKQVYAAQRRWQGRRRLSEEAARLFLEHHLGRWVGAFADGVQKHTALPAYRELARCLREAVAAECRRLRVWPRLAPGRLPYDEMQADEFLCPHDAAVSTAPA